MGLAGAKHRISLISLPNAEQEFYSQLVKTFIGQVALSEGNAIKIHCLEPGRTFGTVTLPNESISAVVVVDLLEKRLDLLVSVEALGLLLQDQVGAHTTARKGAYIFLTRAAIGMSV